MRHVMLTGFGGMLIIGLILIGCGRSEDPAPSSSTSADFMSTPADQLPGIVKPLPADAAPTEQQIFRYLQYEPNSLDVSMTIYESGGSPFVFERLALLNHENELVPGAADRWDVSEDGMTWTFYLHPGARWSDDRPVTAYDFEYSFKRMLEPNSGNVYAFFYYDIKGAKAYNQRQNPDPESVGIKAINDLTLTIETEKPCAYLPHIMQFPTSSPVPRWQVEKYGKRWTEAGNCVSNAVYQLDEWKTGKYMSFSLNPYYNGNNPTFLRKVYRIFNASVSNAGSGGALDVIAYDNDEVDLANVRPIELVRITQDPKLKDQLWSFDAFTTFYIFFRTRQPPFDDIRIRKAFAHAIDKASFVKINLQDMMLPAYTMLPRNFPGYTGEKYKGIQAFDPDKARRYLAEAGFPNGRGFPTIEMWLDNASPGTPISQAAQAVQEMLRENLNVKVELRNVERTTYRNSLNNWVMPISIIAFNYDFPDPHSMLGIIWRSQPRGYSRHDWNNPRFNALIDRAAGEMNQGARMKMYDEAEGVLVSDFGGVFLWHVLSYQLRKPWVKGLLENQYGNTPHYPNHTSFMEIYIGKDGLPDNRPVPN